MKHQQQAKTHSSQLFTDYQLMVTAHEGNKKAGELGSATMWVGVISMETFKVIADEIDCARDLELLIKYGDLHTFGGIPDLRGIKFRWVTVDTEDENTLERGSIVKTQVAITYMSDIRSESIAQQQRRFFKLTGEQLEFDNE